MFALDLALVLTIMLMSFWVAQPFGQVLLLSRDVRDDFGSVVPYVQQQYRQQITRLVLRLFALIVVGVIAYASCAPV